MKKNGKVIKDCLLTIIILCAFFAISLGIEIQFDAYSLIPAFFSLAVFLISFFTDGYIFGILSSLVSVLMVNFAFTFPYFKFNFSIPVNLFSAVVMLCITIMTCALTTKLKQTEKIKAETEKEKMRANLLRAITHDLRTPLTTIYGSSSAMLENYNELSDEQFRQLADGIKEDSQWLIGMVENLLSVTRIDNGGVKLIKTLVVLEELIDSVLVRFYKRYPKQKVNVDIPSDFISIPMDAVLITQVLVNMLENAVQHAMGMTELILRVSVKEDNAVFEIIDNGCGIPKEYLNTVFTGYFEKKGLHVDHQSRCMGIGLSVCASVIKAHEGEISVENLIPKGCCFRFTLKMEEEDVEWQ